MNLLPEQVNTVFEIAKQAIDLGLNGEVLNESSLNLSVSSKLNEKAATFVTLNKKVELRGCIGSIQAYRTLAEDVYSNAYSAAFRDPRFKPLAEYELTDLDIEISVLTPPEPIEKCFTKSTLLDGLEPYKDGLIISDGINRATFLPSVWEQLPDKEMFVNHLMRKAGIGFWSDKITCQRYYVKSYSREWINI
ncbi:MAG: AmmeMemoRadiSam system protein A [Pseudomonadota bacterium]|nr:AmmeMemoRadiSam system protein A [Pseudomonadota bacterium]